MGGSHESPFKMKGFPTISGTSPAKQKTHEAEVKEVQEGQKAFVAKKQKQIKKTESKHAKQVKAYDTSMDSISNVNKSYQTQQQKDYNTLSVAAYNKKYPQKSPAKQVTREQRLTDSSQSAPADATPRELYKKHKATKKPQKAPEKQASPAKQTYDKSETDERVYDIDQNKYDSWRQGIGKNAPDIRYLGAKENKKHLEHYLNRPKAIKPAKPVQKIKAKPVRTPRI